MNIFTSLLRKDEKKSAGRAPAAGKKEKPVALFSKAHWLRLEAVLNRERLQQPGLISLVIKQSDTGMAYTLVFEDGKLSLRAGAEKSSLLLSGTGTVWRSIFKGLMDPFTAVIQHKMSLEGSMQEFLQLYPLLRTVFKVWQTIPVST
jgi:putative sterol carrier protein